MPPESGRSEPGAADVFSARCPSRAALDLIAHTWAVLVASSLADGPKRHSRLRTQIGGISSPPETFMLDGKQHLLATGPGALCLFVLN